MAWYDDYLQQGKGLIQQGQNWLTGNNLTSQNPNTVRAMNMEANNPFDPNARISPTSSFSDRRYEDTGGVHPPLALPTQTRNLNYNIHQDPPRNWREDYQGTYGAPTPDLYSNEPAMMNLKRDGIMASNQAQKKDGILQKIMNNTIMGQIMGNFKDSPQEKFNREYFNTTDQGRIGGNAANELFSGKNVSYAFGPGLEVGGQKRIDTINKALAKMEGGKSWTQLKEDDLQAWEAKRDALRAKQIAFTKQLAQYNQSLAAKTGKKQVIEAPVKAAVVPHEKGERDTRGWSSPGYSTRGGFTGKADPTSGGVRGHHGNWAQGGRVGYQGGELVGQETDFIQGPQGADEFQETIVEGQEEPSREELEALAMDIFQLPLEELNEEQLMVVYQAAMQEQPMEEDFQEQDIQYADRGQPMEEDISEEDIQYAAGGGRIGFRYGGLVSLL